MNTRPAPDGACAAAPSGIDAASTVQALLGEAALPRTEARRLLAATLGVPIETLIAGPERRVEADARARFDSLCARRRRGEPVAYLLGEKEFYGRRFAVSPAVLVPRPETELLVELALQRAVPCRAPRILDLGTGSGCVAITLAREHPAASVLAVDRSGDALAIARANASQLGADVEFLASDWFDAIRGRFDVIVANPPYVASDDPHLGALRHEPRQALVAGADGLDDLRRIVAQSPSHLERAGWLLVEHGHEQGPYVRDLFRHAAFADIETHRDLAGIERVTFGTWTATGG